MSLPTQTGTAPAQPAAPRRRFRLWVLLFAAALLALAVGVYFWYPFSHPMPPHIDLTGADPAVAEAVNAARNRVLQAPRSAAAWGRLGMVLAAHQFTDEALECLGQAERLDARNPRWPYHQGVICQDTRRVPEAVARLRRAVELCGRSPDAPRLRLAELLVNQGEEAEAAALFEEVLKADPANPRAHLGLGRLALARGDPEEGLAHVRHALASPHTRKAAARLQAQLHQRQGKDPAADLVRLADLPEDVPWPDPYLEEAKDLAVGEVSFRLRAAALLQEGRPKEALEALQEPLRRYPRSAMVWKLAGRAHLDLGQPEEAARAFTRALELQPDDGDPHVFLGILAEHRRDAAVAVREFRMAVQLKPVYAPAYCKLARALMAQRDEAGAVEVLRQALRNAPPDAKVHAMLGELLARAGQTQEARTHLRTAVSLDPQDTESKRLLERLAP